jgi:YD repeat-containing protein
MKPPKLNRRRIMKTGQSIFAPATIATVVLAALPAFAAIRYEYDALNRLTQATNDNGSVVFFDYDAAGNRLLRATNIDTNSVYLATRADLPDAGVVCRSPGQAWYTTGTPVVLTAIAEGACSFDRWLGNVPPGEELTNPLVLTMDGYKSVTARFSPPKGDRDSDCDVDLVDFAGMQACFGVQPMPITCLGLDFNDDGLIDLSDLNPFIDALNVHVPHIDDCNSNGVADTCDIAAGTSADVDTNGVPDECDPSASNTLTLQLGGGVTMELVKISAGSFVMGSDVYTPPHTVTFSQDFYIGRREVTQAQWQAVVGGTPPWDGLPYVLEQDDAPAVYVNWMDAVQFCQALSTITGHTIRLASEAEWEYATRAGTTSIYSFGGDIADLGMHAWYHDNAWGAGEQYAHPVGQKLANPWLLYDVHGNVWEWCEDNWHADYIGAPTDGSAWTTGGDPVRRVLRGGSHYDAGNHLRSDHRDRSDDTKRSHNIGFRIAARIGS